MVKIMERRLSVRTDERNAPKPQAFISTRKNRIKHTGIYRVKGSGSVHRSDVYFKDGTEFEIELNNPSPFVYVAEITVNGDAVSGGGIILRPGAHEYLERYVEAARRFKYVTYMADKANTQAIKDNGVIEVRFKREVLPTSPTPTVTRWLVPAANPFLGFGSGPTNNMFYTRVAGTSNLNVGSYTNVASSISYGVGGETVETGRVEQGGTSTQAFQTEYGLTFSTQIDHIVYLNILPVVEPSEPETVIAGWTIGTHITVYCTECGRKQKREWKFCPGCGNKA